MITCRTITLLDGEPWRIAIASNDAPEPFTRLARPLFDEFCSKLDRTSKTHQFDGIYRTVGESWEVAVMALSLGSSDQERKVDANIISDLGVVDEKKLVEIWMASVELDWILEAIQIASHRSANQPIRMQRWLEYKLWLKDPSSRPMRPFDEYFLACEP